MLKVLGSPAINASSSCVYWCLSYSPTFHSSSCPCLCSVSTIALTSNWVYNIRKCGTNRTPPDLVSVTTRALIGHRPSLPSWHPFIDAAAKGGAAAAAAVEDHAGPLVLLGVADDRRRWGLTVAVTVYKRLASLAASIIHMVKWVRLNPCEEDRNCEVSVKRIIIQLKTNEQTLLLNVVKVVIR